MMRLPNPQPPRRREDLSLNEDERALVVALAKWKARNDYEEWCSRLPRDQYDGSASHGKIQTYALSRDEYADMTDKAAR